MVGHPYLWYSTVRTVNLFFSDYVRATWCGGEERAKTELDEEAPYPFKLPCAPRVCAPQLGNKGDTPTSGSQHTGHHAAKKEEGWEEEGDGSGGAREYVSHPS